MILPNKLQTKIFGYIGNIPYPDKWIFIVSCYNSGSTLLHSILANHPQIGSMPNEGQFYTDQLLLPKSLGLPRLWALKPELFYMDDSSDNDIDVRKLKKQWSMRFNYPNRPFLIEKSPTNAGRTLWLQKHFENSYFIGIIRNGFAVAEGIKRKTGHSISDAAIQWRISNEIMLRDIEYLENKILMRYEDFTDDPVERLEEVLLFIGVEPIELNNYLDRTWKIHEKESKILNMNKSSINSLTNEESKRIEEVAGDLLKQLNYI